MKQQLVDLKARDINKLLGTGADPQLTAENSEEEKEVTVSFFVTEKHLDQTIIGHNVFVSQR